MKIFISSLLLIILVSAVNAQVYQDWVQRYNGSGNLYDNAFSSALDNSGNTYVTGHSYENGTQEDITTIKYSSSGIQQWIQRYNGPGSLGDYACDISVDNSGNIYVSGTSFAFDTGDDITMIKYSSSGMQLWVQRYNGPGNSSDKAYQSKVDALGNVYVTGYSKGVTTDFDMTTIKYNSLGVQQWVQRYNGPVNSWDIASSIVLDNSFNVYISGFSENIGTGYDITTIKYNSLGVQQWLQKYNGTGNGQDDASSILVDNSANVYVTGHSNGVGTGSDMITLKYSSSGVQQWVQRYNGPGNLTDGIRSSVLDNSGNIYVCGLSTGAGSGSDFTTIKYNPSGAQQWIQRYNGLGNIEDDASAITIDGFDNIYVTGFSSANINNRDMITIKYNSFGTEQWIQKYNGPGNSEDQSLSVSIDNSANVYITGFSMGINSNSDYVTIKYTQQQLSFNQPLPYSKCISGDTTIIQWTGFSHVNIKCTLNVGTSAQSIIPIATNYSNITQQCNWIIPDNLLSYRSKITIENANDPIQKVESGIFRIKPYLLTKVNSDSTYYEYKKERDQWGFSNDSTQMWPYTWYQQFNYQGVDPFTGSNYPQWQGSFAFKEAKSQNFPDWVSWVNTFTVNSCYWSTSLRIYKRKAILRWKATKDTAWGGSCFGLAISNGIVFKNKAEFQSKYPNFPQFVQPSQLNSGNQVRQTVNEIFTHQFGQQHVNYTIDSGLKKTPTMTLNRIKELLLSDNDPVRTLTIYNNSGKGGHAILPYRIVRNSSSGDIYSLYVYDNSIPLSTTPIIINTADSNGNGSWKTTDWPGWGGEKNFFLMDPAQLYLINPSLSRIKLETSAFDLSDSILQVFHNKNCFIKIKDLNGNVTGYQNDSILNDIPHSYPLIKQDGRETPPYGFQFRSNNYSVALTNFTSDTTNVYFFTGNKSFEYQRSGAALSQTDKFLFNKGLSVINTDSQLKDINLLNIQDETTQEKSFILTSLEMLQNDSLKLENLEENNVKLTSYGSAKNYNVELNLASSTGLGIFNGINIQLPANSSHTFIPNWTNLQTSQLIILEDIGNNGTIDDTLRINNIITGENGIGNLSLPNNYCLYQNYPNPFNPATLIKYDLKNNGIVRLKVYDLLGREIQTLVDEAKLQGSYEVGFDASLLSSGIYFYRLETNGFIQIKKMVVLK